MESNDPVSKLAATVTGSRNDDKGLNGGGGHFLIL